MVSPASALSAAGSRDDHALAARLAEEAGGLLLRLRDDPDLSGDPDALCNAGDRLSHELLAKRLAEHRPDDAVLSEEAPDNPARLKHRRVWILDPLDGTRQYGEPPRKDWAVHVALAVNGRAEVGAVALPGESGTILSTAAPPELAQHPNPRRRQIVVAASRSRRVPQAEAAAAYFRGRLLKIGSVGAKAASVIRGKADIYLHSGGQWEWDSAAPAAVALACGLWVSRLDGSELRYNRPNPYVEDLLFCRQELAESVLSFLAEASPEGMSGRSGVRRGAGSGQSRPPSNRG